MPVRAHHGVSPCLHPSVYLADGAFVIGDVRGEKDAGIWYNAFLRGDINAIRIDERTNIQDGCDVHVTKELPLIVGNDVTVGHQAVIHSCSIGERVLVGLGALVLENAVVPEVSLVAGVPGRIVRKLTGEERRRLRESAQKYVTYAQSLLNGQRGTEKV